MGFKLEDRLLEKHASYGKAIGDYLVNTAKEKVELFTNPKKLYNEMVELGRKEGIPFMCYAITVEVCEDVVLPFVLYNTGYEELIPAVLMGHSEPVMYPLYFGVRKLYRSLKKNEE